MSYKINNPWIGYLQRSYKDIKASLLSKLGTILPEISDHSESNVMVVILDAISGVAESLNYYIDNVARESFISTARRFSSAVKLSRIVDYRIKSANPSSGSLTVYLYDSEGNPTGSTVSANVPINSVFSTEEGIEFFGAQGNLIPLGSSFYTFGIIQGTIISGAILNVSKGISNEISLLPDNSSNLLLSITIDGDDWIQKNTLAYSKSNDKHFVVDVDIDKKSFIRFGDNINGQIPPANFDIIADYLITKGSIGNVDKNTIIQSSFDFAIALGVDNFKISNSLGTSGGSDVESLSSLKKSLPLSTRTRERAINTQDYIDLANLTPGVLAADLKYECGNPYISIFIYPEGGGVAQSSLLTVVENYLADKIMFSTTVKSFPAGESIIIIDVDVVGKANKTELVINNEIKNKLQERYGLIDSIINKDIRESDIISAIDNLPSVEYLKLNSFRISSFINPIEHSNIISPILNILGFPENIREYKIYYDNTDDDYKLIYKGNIQFDIVKGTNQSDNDNLFEINLPISTPNFTQDLYWNFYIYPKGDIKLVDFSVPKYSHSLSTINITEIR